jgi:hypothetical protein
LKGMESNNRVLVEIRLDASQPLLVNHLLQWFHPHFHLCPPPLQLFHPPLQHSLYPARSHKSARLSMVLMAAILTDLESNSLVLEGIRLDASQLRNPKLQFFQRYLHLFLPYLQFFHLPLQLLQTHLPNPQYPSQTIPQPSHIYHVYLRLNVQLCMEPLHLILTGLASSNVANKKTWSDVFNLLMVEVMVQMEVAMGQMEVAKVQMEVITGQMEVAMGQM